MKPRLPRKFNIPETPNPVAFPYGEHKFRDVVIADIRANHHDPASQILMVTMRCSQYVIGRLGRRHPLSLATIIAERLFSELVFNTELRPTTSVGPGLTIYHRTGLVVNDQAIIGSNVKLRHNVTIGHKVSHGGCPVISDGVEIGAGAILIGEILIGRNARIAAGAVVVSDVGDGMVVAGNPARPI